MKLAALGRLTANIAHEISNPLSRDQPRRRTAAGGAELERHGRAAADIIHDNAKRLDRMVNDVLN